MRRARLTHATRVALPFERAMRCFTPVGERAWVDGWEPAFPAGPPDGDGDGPGTVFTAADAVWVVVDRAPDRIRYARVTPGVMAGTVTVRGRADGEATAVEVTYALTALGEEGARRIDDLAARFAEYVDGWAAAIAARVAPG